MFDFDDETKITATQMLIHAFERSIGARLRQLQRPPEKASIARARRDTATTTNVNSLVEEAYLLELLDWFLEVCPQDEEESARRLRHWLDANGISDIRNRTSHTNRVITEHHLAVAVALATHPAAFNLKLQPMIEALEAIREGAIKAPPEAYFNRIRATEIPNNFRSKSQDFGDHSIFLGRDSEVNETIKFLKKPKLASVTLVGPGGTGKTAIAAAVLDKLRTSPETEKHFDRLVFVSLKTHRLDENNEQKKIRDLSDDLILELQTQITEAIYPDEDFDPQECPAIIASSKERVLLCLDNLEELILDNEDLLEHFLLETIPVDWKALVTSRIPFLVGKSMTVEPLPEQVRFAIAMQRAKLLAEDLPRPTAQHFAEQLQTPLEIRIATTIAVTTLQEPEHITEKVRAASKEYAYSSLLEALSQECLVTLALLTGLHAEVDHETLARCSNGQIGEEAARARLAELKRFGLVSLQTGDNGAKPKFKTRMYLGDEIIKVAPSLREVMNQASRAFDQHRQSERIGAMLAERPLEEGNKKHNLAIRLIESQTDRENAREALRQIQQGSINLEGIKRLTEGFSPNDQSIIIASFAMAEDEDHLVKMHCERLISKTGPRQNAALSLADKRSAWASCMLADYYRKSQRHSLAPPLLKPWVEQAIDKPEALTSFLSGHIVFTYFTSIFWSVGDEFNLDRAAAQNKLEEATSFLRRKASEASTVENQFLLLNYRAGGERRFLEDTTLFGSNRRRRVENCLDSFSEVLEIAKQSGTQGNLIELSKFLDEITRSSERGLFKDTENTAPQASSLHDLYARLDAFLVSHASEIKDYSPTSSAARRLISHLLSQQFPVSEALKDLFLGRSVSITDGSDLSDIQRQSGYILANITDCFNHDKPFGFARDAEGHDHFLSRDSFSATDGTNSTDQLVELRRGTKVAVLPGTPDHPGRAPRALDFQLLE